MKDAILLVFANKQDQAGALGAQGVSRTRVRVCAYVRVARARPCYPRPAPHPHNNSSNRR